MILPFYFGQAITGVVWHKANRLAFGHLLNRCLVALAVNFGNS